MNLTDDLGRQAEEQPDALAAIHGDIRLSYRMLDGAVWRAAASLRTQGVAPGTVVGLTLASPLAHLVVALALARMGAVQIALAPTDPPEERRERARVAGVSVLVGDLPDAAAAGLPVLPAEEAWLVPGEVPEMAGLRSDDGSLAWLVCHSSGTTGRPKMFAISHAQELARRRREPPDSAPRREDVVLTPSPPDFAVAKRYLFMALAHGGTCVLARLPSAETFARLCDGHAVSWAFAVPTFLARLAAAFPNADGPRFPGLRVLRTAGSTVDDALRRLVLERISAGLAVVYASNEAATMAVAEPQEVARLPGTVGRVVPGLRWEIVDEADRPVPAGTPGRFRVRGPGVVIRYLGDADQTRSLKDGWYYPGDLLSADAQGLLTFHSRDDDMMILDGINIFPAEIERVLLEHPAVAEAAAFPLRRPHRDVPMAAVVLHRPAGEAELSAFARARLGVRTPRRIFVVPALPRNAMGKVLRRELSAGLRGDRG